jgi:hypothetical protein
MKMTKEELIDFANQDQPEADKFKNDDIDGVICLLSAFGWVIKKRKNIYYLS